MISTELFVAVFLAYVVLDIAWAKYTQAISKDKKLDACFWSAVVPVISAFLVIQYVSNIFVLIPMSLGAATGTWIAMTYIK